MGFDVYDLAMAGIAAVGLWGAAFAVRWGYLLRESNNKTHVARVEADMMRDKQRHEHEKEMIGIKTESLRDLVESPGFQKYLETKANLAGEVAKADPSFIRSGRAGGRYVDAVCGELPKL